MDSSSFRILVTAALIISTIAQLKKIHRIVHDHEGALFKTQTAGILSWTATDIKYGQEP